MVCAEQSVQTNQTTNTLGDEGKSQSDPDKRARAKGKQPRPKAKVPKCILSVKGSTNAQTARRLAQRQPSFKESVTAHLSIPVHWTGGCGCADNVTGLKDTTEAWGSHAWHAITNGCECLTVI